MQLACVDGSDMNAYDIARRALVFASQAFESVIAPSLTSSSSGSKPSKSMGGRKSRGHSGSASVTSKSSVSGKTSKGASKVGKFKLNL